MTDQTISPILTRLTDIVADLNQALDIARGQGVKHRLAVVKTLGSDPPRFQVALIDPAAIVAEAAAPAEDDTPLATARPAGDIEVDTVGLVEVLDFSGWCLALEDALAKAPDILGAFGEAGGIPADFPEVWRPHFEAGRSPADAMVAHLLTLAPVKAPTAPEAPAAPEGGTP